MSPRRTSVATADPDDMTASWDGLLSHKKVIRINDEPLRLVPRQDPYRIRLACTPLRFRRHLWAFTSLGMRPISPASDPAEKSLDVAWDEGGFTPRLRYAAFVFDRDDGRLRIVEDGSDLFGPIFSHACTTASNPASPTKGWDWLVKVAWVPLGSGAGTVRRVVVLPDTARGMTPFTDEEFGIFDDPKCWRDELETKHFVKESPNRIRDLWSQVAPP